MRGLDLGWEERVENSKAGVWYSIGTRADVDVVREGRFCRLIEYVVS
jgi:hypothetical protein